MKKVIWMIGILFGITLTAGFLLSWVYAVTTVKIEQQKKEKLQSALEKVLPQADSFSVVLGNKVWFGFKDGKKKGLVFRVLPRGYGGEIEIIVGIDMDEKVTGVSIGDMKETPGLGTKTKDESFLKQFIGKGVKNIRLRQDGGEIEGITAATISSRSVTDGIRDGIKKYRIYLHAVNTPYIKDLLPDANLIVEERPDTILVGFKDTVKVGYVVISKAKGFSGEFPVAVSFDINLVVKKIWIADKEHGFNETEGFGSKIRDSSFINQFSGKKEEEIEGIDTITGATVSSKSVIDAVKLAFTYINQYCK